MKAINKFFGIALMALGVLSVASCADENDWGVDSAFDRLFGVGEDALSVETTESTATVTFSALKATSDTIYFVIEVSKDSLYDEVEMGGSNAKVYGTNKEIKSSPYEITGLESDTKYYLRIKASSDTKADSKWVYYNNGGTFKTKAEQIFNAVEAANVGEDHVKLTWMPGAEVTLLTVATADGTVVKEIDLTQYPDAIEKGEYDVTGLTASTSYTFVIYNGETKRGTLNVTTAAAMPAGDYKVQLDESITQITQDVMDKFVADAQAATGKTDVSITIGIAGGKTVTVADVDDKGENASLAVPDGISVTFFGLAGEVPTLSFPKSLEIGGEHAYVRFENLILKDDGCQYIFNQSKACNVGEISFNGIKIDGLERSLVRLQSSDAKTVGTIIINGSMSQTSSENTIIMTAEGATVQIDKLTGNVKISELQLFEVGSYQLSPKGKQFLDKFVPIYINTIFANPILYENVQSIVVQGHTDSQMFVNAKTPEEQFSKNMELSLQRAGAVQEYMLKTKYDKKNAPTLRKILVVEGKSFSEPVLDANGKEDYAKSRRVELKLRVKGKSLSRVFGLNFGGD